MEQEEYYSLSYTMEPRETWILDSKPKLLENGRKRIHWLLKNNPTIIIAKIESHQPVKRGKILSSQVIYRESYNRESLGECLVEISPHLSGINCPIHRTPYRDQVGRRGLEIINGICDECLNDYKEKRS